MQVRRLLEVSISQSQANLGPNLRYFMTAEIRAIFDAALALPEAERVQLAEQPPSWKKSVHEPFVRCFETRMSS
jgi:hypothetical protein